MRLLDGLVHLLQAGEEDLLFLRGELGGQALLGVDHHLMALGMEAVMASGTAKVVNLTSNVAALISLATTGNVLIALGLPAAVCGIAGNWLGAGLTMKKGAGFIRYMLLVVLALLLAKMVLDVL